MNTPSPGSKLRVNCFSVSLDGFGAGPRQDPQNPLGVGGVALPGGFFRRARFKRWLAARTARRASTMISRCAACPASGRGFLGATCSGPIRGEWPDDQWKGWWGNNPPYHTSVFVLTHHPRAPLVMEGGTTFHFVTDGIHAALSRACEAAQGKDVRLGGGVATIRQYLQAGLIDEMHLAVSPVLLGQGENLFAGLDLPKLGYERTEHVPSASATHVVFTKRA
ncbi:MAG: dihydrofolate reductase family protein [Undibacterium sp.]|nr:dihydrofolate reductase family protein [Opitutaceae bacterium]